MANWGGLRAHLGATSFKTGRLSLAARGRVWVLAAAIVGALCGGVWVQSQARWQAHLTQAQLTGMGVFDTLAHGAPLPPGVVMTRLNAADVVLAEAGAFGAISGLGPPVYLTRISLYPAGADRLEGARIGLVIASSDLVYPLADLRSRPEIPAAPASLAGGVARIMASYCSDPVVFAHIPANILAQPLAGRQSSVGWWQVSAPNVWGCDAAPRDLRLPALFVLVVMLGSVLVQVQDTVSGFRSFARALATRRRVDAPMAYDADGPAELHDIIMAVNTHLAAERVALDNRVMVLSGVSHDLGTPATRLRLRSALIEDPDLRARIETDIDRMTGMIDSVLTYTRAEMSDEPPRPLSLSALAEAVVDDYQDMGRPVSMAPPVPLSIGRSRSLFQGRAGVGHIAPAAPHQIIVSARPQALHRALTNLIDNALKYGKRAVISCGADAETAWLSVEDEGSALTADQIAGLTAPFQRGANAGQVPGVGLGLSIVQSIAESHGGDLRFELGRQGLRAVLRITRQPQGPEAAFGQI